MEKNDPPIWANVMLVDCLRETMVERRFDVSGWRSEGIVELRESECVSKPRRARLVASDRRRIPDPMTKWRVYPVMRPGQLDDLLHARIRNTGRWIAFRQGLDPVATERELRRLKHRDRGLACFILLVFIVSAIVHFSG